MFFPADYLAQIVDEISDANFTTSALEVDEVSLKIDESVSHGIFLKSSDNIAPVIHPVRPDMRLVRSNRADLVAVNEERSHMSIDSRGERHLIAIIELRPIFSRGRINVLNDTIAPKECAISIDET